MLFGSLLMGLPVYLHESSNSRPGAVAIRAEVVIRAANYQLGYANLGSWSTIS
jgi:hypothetical protein